MVAHGGQVVVKLGLDALRRWFVAWVGRVGPAGRKEQFRAFSLRYTPSFLWWIGDGGDDCDVDDVAEFGAAPRGPWFLIRVRCGGVFTDLRH